MSAREWKPGDVAKAAYPDWSTETYTERLIVRGAGCWVRLDDTDDFVHDDSPNRPASPQRMVVIDPEDREQVERLIRAMDAKWGEVDDRTDWWEAIPRMQAALREFASPTPPKPDEPTGLGAVVEDRWGHVFVRTGVRAWRNTNEESFCIWAHIDAVRVLSEGVRA